MDAIQRARVDTAPFLVVHNRLLIGPNRVVLYRRDALTSEPDDAPGQLLTLRSVSGSSTLADALEAVTAGHDLRVVGEPIALEDGCAWTLERELERSVAHGR